MDRRDYTELARLSPQVTKSPNGGLSFAGQHDRFNSIQIDGTNNNDLFGSCQSGNGTPGWAVGLTAFTPEAVKELQIVTAPFDVRYGNFAGGLINAVTRSGSNRVEGSILGYLESSGLVGTDSTGSRGDEFSRKEFGLTLGAPIVRDRVALFVNAAVRRRGHPPVRARPEQRHDGRSGFGRRGNRIREPGAFPGPPAGPRRRAGELLRRRVPHTHQKSLRQGHGAARGEQPPGGVPQLRPRQRPGEIGRDLGFYALSSNGSENPETINATRLAWTAAFGTRFSNELILARVDDRRTCLPNSRFPSVS